MRMILDNFFPKEKEEIQNILYLRQLLKCGHGRPLDSKLYFAHLFCTVSSSKTQGVVWGCRCILYLKYSNNFSEEIEFLK